MEPLLEDQDFWYVVISPICASWFALVSLGFMYVDLSGKPTLLAQRKLQPEYRPSREDYAKLWYVVVSRSGSLAFAMCPILTLFLYRYFEVTISHPGLARC
eukprot:TRINITY_DN62747_c0_g1_i1.p4 TRINITY_DN62747_c0_g1~~TRINITY_DN62747_c0_g1_i1.p4  ORF type:complete len:101 (-),score=14.44 TRINITY_DN62747_c0_g1_i1:529-831(-)